MNMKIRLTICLYILSVLFSLVIMVQVIGNGRHEPEYTGFSKGVATTTGVYFYENWNEKGRVYLINAAGDVLKMTDSGAAGMDSVEGADVANGSVYVIYGREAQDEDEVVTYRIVQYDPQFEFISRTHPFVIDADEDVRSLDIENDGAFVTTIGKAGDKANVYKLDMSLFADEDSTEGEGKAEANELSSVVYRESRTKGSFADAYYNGTDIVLLLDKESPSGRFAPDLRVATAVSRIHFNPLQQVSLYSNYVAWWLGGLLIWFIVLTLTLIMIRRRNRSVYAFAISEGLFFILLLAAVIFAVNEHEENELLSDARYGLISLSQGMEYIPELGTQHFDAPGYYEGSDYETEAARLRDFAESGYNKDFFYDIFVQDHTTGLIVLDVRGHARENASFVYGSTMADLQKKMRDHSRSAYELMQIDGKDALSFAIAQDDPSSKYSLVAICRRDSFGKELWDDTKDVMFFFISVFFVGSLLIGIVYYLLNQDMHRFEKSIRDVALGQTTVDVPQTISEDMISMYGSLSEICKRMGEINYEKYRIFEAYYRFAPKKIEKIMGKDSIFDVKNGDMVKVDGTLMLLTSADTEFGEGKKKTLKNIISYMGRFAGDEEGIMISQDSSLSILRFFFPGDFTGTAQRATGFLQGNFTDAEAGFVSGFLYYEPFVYGVDGVNSQSLCYITSENARELEEYATWFAMMKIPLIMTEKVAKREEAGQLRHIGFILLSKERRRVELYEVIDAETAKLRARKLALRERFEETLQLFYQKEYYIARNRFSAILKECPEDTLTRWYIFECERYLNREMSEENTGELRITDGR